MPPLLKLLVNVSVTVPLSAYVLLLALTRPVELATEDPMIEGVVVRSAFPEYVLIILHPM